METQRVERNEIPMNRGYLIPLNRPGLLAVEVGDMLSIGRDVTCSLQLHDSFVSLRHARIERRGQRFIVRDMQSRNGTLVNGSPVLEAALHIGDRLQVGETQFVFSETPLHETKLTSKNTAWNEQLKRLPAFSQTHFPVLICGPSGSGKEVIARAIHESSPRSQGPFISINCSALSESLIESELFGHVRGSFTGATHDRKGAFEAARGGTLFLDEIGDLPISLQPKLLRALENNEIRPVGSDRDVTTDVRIVAATHKNLFEAAGSGRFRQDLFYRLNVCVITPPALVDRREDFEDLLYGFAKLFRVRFSHGAILQLRDYTWPGNIRELKNLVARASAYFPGQLVQPADLEKIIDQSPFPTNDVQQSIDTAVQNARGSVIKEIEREMILRRLIANNGNQRRTAADLGLPKSTLHDRIKSYSIDLKSLSKN